MNSMRQHSIISSLSLQGGEQGRIMFGSFPCELCIYSGDMEV